MMVFGMTGLPFGASAASAVAIGRGCRLCATNPIAHRCAALTPWYERRRHAYDGRCSGLVCGACAGLGHGQREGEAGTASGALVIGGDAAAVRLDDRAADGKAHSHPAVL